MPNLYDKNSITKTFPISIWLCFSHGWHTTQIKCVCVSLVYSFISVFSVLTHTNTPCMREDKQKRVKM